MGSYLMAPSASIAGSRGFPSLHVWTGSAFAETLDRYRTFGFVETTVIPPDVASEANDFTSLERMLKDVRAVFPLHLHLETKAVV
jgi:hypothetical protein